MPAIVVNRDHVTVDALLEHHRAAVGADMFAHQPVSRVHRDVTEVLCPGMVGHFEAQLVVRVQHRRVIGHAHHGFLDLCQLLEGLDAAEAHVVGADVDTGANIALTVSEPGAQNAAARGFEHGEIDGRVA